jgi:murein DD-endopeptidase MepM/ murein hydrolase activator NlpD
MRKWCRRVLWSGLLLVLAFVAWFLLFTGPRNLDRYPPSAASPYRLPWPAGVKYLCVQGNRAVVSHRGRDEFAYDFAMPVGSDVCAARAGIVSRVVVTNDGHGFRARNNSIAIRHEDGTYAQYLHLRRGGSYVRVGERVEQGQRIAASGHVGRSMLPHLHFQVTGGGGRLLRVTFADVEVDRGIPRMFKSYTAGRSSQPVSTLRARAVLSPGRGENAAKAGLSPRRQEAGRWQNPVRRRGTAARAGDSGEKEIRAKYGLPE